MLIGYVRASKSDGSQAIELQRDALIAAGVDPAQIYLTKQGVGFKVLTGHAASIDTTTPAGKLVFGIFGVPDFIAINTWS
jgi:DNA invertase Pin-like site-specific DNA recombinase